MTSYLSYETEKREIITSPVNVLKLDLSVRTLGWAREYSDSFEISFHNEFEGWEFIKFFGIEHSQENWKYIKHDLLLYHKEMKLDFRGCFPQEFDNQSVVIHYDYFATTLLEKLPLDDMRELKLKSIGI